MANVNFKREINVPAAKVWETLGDFNALPSFIPTIANSEQEGEGEGAIRTLTMADGNKVVEKLEHLDHGEMTLKYSIIEGGLPVTDYLSTMKVNATGDDSCEVEWGGQCTAAGMSEEDVEKILTGMYTGGLKALSIHMDK